MDSIQVEKWDGLSMKLFWLLFRGLIMLGILGATAVSSVKFILYTLRSN